MKIYDLLSRYVLHCLYLDVVARAIAESIHISVRILPQAVFCSITFSYRTKLLRKYVLLLRKKVHCE